MGLTGRPSPSPAASGSHHSSHSSHAHSAHSRSRRRSSFTQPSSQLKFRPSGSSADGVGRGTRPLPEPMAVHDFIQMIVVHGCKKILLVDHRLKVAAYLGLTFVLSIFADAFNFPRSYFSNPRNALNRLFVGFGWGWTLILVLSFVVMTGLVKNCGDRRKVALYHASRMVVGTFMWWSWTTLFAVLEQASGTCSQSGFSTKRLCRDGGHKWRSFDISGHTFLLIYCNLLIMEEARAILGWDGIKDSIRKEDYNRNELPSTSTLSRMDSGGGAGADTETNLKDLSDSEFEEVKFYYSRLALPARLNFIFLTLLSLVYDALFLATVIYYHVMTEKLIAAGCAVLAWFITYRLWFAMAPFPLSPGKGSSFRTDQPAAQSLPLRRNRSFDDQTPTFMGMPLRRHESFKDPSEGGAGESR